MNATSNFASKVRGIYSIESLSSGDTCIHRLHPATKIVSTLAFLFAVISFDRYEFARLIPYLFYPVVVMALAEIPYPIMLGRFALALPFCFFAGIANVAFDTKTAFLFIGTPISYGVLSFLAILFRAYLCVMAVLILVAVTPFTQLTGQLRRMRVPEILVTLFEVTYRYLGTLMGEASSMYTAYTLRTPGRKGLKMDHMGSFVGQLLIRSIDRAERVYNAMKCRGYAIRGIRCETRALSTSDWTYLVAVCGACLFFRATDIPKLFGDWIGKLL